jgi:hypothetical protein
MERNRIIYSSAILEVIFIIFIMLASQTNVIAQISNKQEILYKRLLNPIDISVPNVSQSKLKVSAEGGKVIKQNDIWYAMPQKDEGDFILTVSTNRNNKEVELFSRTYQIRSFPRIRSYIVYKDTSGIYQRYGEEVTPKPISKKMIARAERIEIESPNSELANFLISQFKLKSFEIHVAGANFVKYVSDGDKFTDEQRRIMKNWQGNWFFIQNIQFIGPDSTIYVAIPIEVRLQ